MQRFDMIIPRTAAEAVALLEGKRDESMAKAGGIDLVAGMKDRIFSPRRLVDLLALENLRAIRVEAGELRIGALATLAMVAEHEAIRQGWAALAEAAGSAATPQVRNVATVGGNLCQRPRCWYFRSPDFHCRRKGGGDCPAENGENQFHALFGGGLCSIVHPSNIAPALSAYGARLRILGPGGERELDVDDFFAVPESDVTRENVLLPQELVVEVRIPVAAGAGAFLEVRERQTFDWPLVSVAAVGARTGTVVAGVRLCLGAVAPRPWRLPAVETLLNGKEPSEALFRAAGELAVKDARPLAKNKYKIQLVRTIVARALRAAFAV